MIVLQKEILLSKLLLSRFSMNVSIYCLPTLKRLSASAKPSLWETNLEAISIKLASSSLKRFWNVWKDSISNSQTCWKCFTNKLMFSWYKTTLLAPLSLYELVFINSEGSSRYIYHSSIAHLSSRTPTAPLSFFTIFYFPRVFGQFQLLKNVIW